MKYLVIYLYLMILITGCFLTKEANKKVVTYEEDDEYKREFKNGDFYYLQPTDVKAEELPKDCHPNLIYYINTSWLKHRKNGYHLRTDFSHLISGRRDCFIGMELSFLKRLLGEPDKEETGKWIYQLCNNEINKCSDEDIAEHKKERIKVPSDVHQTYSHWLRQDVVFNHKDSVIINVK